MLPVFSARKRQAAAISAIWPLAPRKVRRAGARWWWRTSTRTKPTWPEQWRAINAAAGVVKAPSPAPYFPYDLSPDLGMIG